MSSTLGQPGFVPSNRTGQSGVGASSIGSLGSGVLQTIEEGAGAQIVDPFYYDKSVGYYQLPSVQRARGDDIKTINITNFGSRGTVTLPRRYFNFGPSAIRFRLPIEYAWSGCEYMINTYNASVEREVVTGNLAQATISDPVTNVQLVALATLVSTSRIPDMDIRNAGGTEFFFESPACDTMLPTSFMSGGVAFAFPTQIELNMGGGGNLTFDRYSNWVAIMASAPYVNIRKDLMRMAGGGLCLDDPDEVKQAPVRWGMKPWLNSAAHSNSKLPLITLNQDGAIASMVTQSFDRKKLVPIEWDILLPIKTPDTNFMYALERRKPLDTSCFSGDFQMTFTWSNFNEWADTGKGYPNAPVYHAQYGRSDGLFILDSNFGGDSGRRAPFTGVAPQGYQAAISDTRRKVVHAGEIGAPMFIHPEFGRAPNITATAVAADVPKQTFTLAPVIGVNPLVWTNHYRVAAGADLVQGVHYATDDLWVAFNQSDGTILANGPRSNVGRPRYPQYLSCANGPVTFKSLQQSAAHVNSSITYPQKFTSVEYINSNLKLTNQALGAYNELRVSKEAVLYYPFQYFFSQIYRVTTSKWKDLNVWKNSKLSDASISNALSDIYSENNKITQMIQMPANPCTAMMVCIFREKDRKTLVQSKANSYSPVLFWNALNPERIDLKDGGNTLFSYRNSIDFEYYSLMDRPDALKVPFRGGHVKVQPKNIYGPRKVPIGGGGGNRGLTLKSNGIAASVYTAANLYAPLEIADGSKVMPFWYVTNVANNPDLPAYGVGFQGTNGLNAGLSQDATSANAFPADDLCEQLSMLGHGRSFFPCHTTEWYEASIIEFPFVMNEPITNEKIVQQTPSFAKTQLQLDFWINPKLKPDNGLDDMYNLTYGLTRAAPEGLGPIGGNQANSGNFAAFSYVGPLSHPVPDCLHECGVNPDHSADMLMREYIPGGAAGTGVSAVLTKGAYADGFTFSDSTLDSWNINNGDLMLHITFCQNQIWTLSPLRTALLQARG